MTRRWLFAFALLALGSTTACGGVTHYAGAKSFAIEGTPADPEPSPAPTVPRVELRDNKIEVKEKIQFDANKATIKKDAAQGLDSLVSKLTGVTLEVIVLVGHTDSVGNDAYNQKLSVRRAEAVKAYLVSKGIEANRIYTEGKGESQPVADNKTAEGRAKNRRVDVEVVGTRAVRR